MSTPPDPTWSPRGGGGITYRWERRGSEDFPIENRPLALIAEWEVADGDEVVIAQVYFASEGGTFCRIYNEGSRVGPAFMRGVSDLWQWAERVQGLQGVVPS